MNYKKIVAILALLFCFTPWADAYWAIGLGITIGILGLPAIHPKMKAWSSDALKYSIVLLGFTIPMDVALKAGTWGLLYSSVSVLAALGLGITLLYVFRLQGKSPLLVNIGTAICGASAIASSSQIIESSEEETGVALILVILLNSLAVFIFPPIGHALGLSPFQFGMWSAIAIHDTSSVSSACAQYSVEAMNIGITIKLLRTLWLVPLSFALYYWFKNSNKKLNFPWFVVFFFLGILINYFIKIPENVVSPIQYIAKHLFYAAIFIMGTGMTIPRLQTIQPRLFLYSIVLWTIIVLANLGIVFYFIK